MYISEERAALALRLLVEGNSLRSTERITGMDLNTLMSLLVKAGDHCQTVMVERIVNVPVHDVQADEIWGFCYKKEKERLESETESHLHITYRAPESFDLHGNAAHDAVDEWFF